MKVHLRVSMSSVHVDEVVEGVTDEEIAGKLRAGLEARAPIMVKMVLRGMDDRTLWRRVVEMYNSRFGASEPAPASAKEFIEFGERAGYVTRLEG